MRIHKVSGFDKANIISIYMKIDHEVKIETSQQKQRKKTHELAKNIL